MALYGHEMSSSINPFEADLGWIVKMDKGDFVGRQALGTTSERRSETQTCGFRDDWPRHWPRWLRSHDRWQPPGWVTSGGPSPTLNKNIGLCYLPVEKSVPGARIEILIRNAPVEAQTVPTPFYKRG